MKGCGGKRFGSTRECGNTSACRAAAAALRPVELWRRRFDSPCCGGGLKARRAAAAALRLATLRRQRRFGSPFVGCDGSVVLLWSRLFGRVALAGPPTLELTQSVPWWARTGHGAWATRDRARVTMESWAGQPESNRPEMLPGLQPVPKAYQN
jgi:hypothetical protein